MSFAFGLFRVLQMCHDPYSGVIYVFATRTHSTIINIPSQIDAHLVLGTLVLRESLGSCKGWLRSCANLEFKIELRLVVNTNTFVKTRIRAKQTVSECMPPVRLGSDELHPYCSITFCRWGQNRSNFNNSSVKPLQIRHNLRGPRELMFLRPRLENC